MIRLHRENTGDYTADLHGHHYRIEKGCVGWNIFRDENIGRNWQAWGYGDNLKEVRAAIEDDND